MITLQERAVQARSKSSSGPGAREMLEKVRHSSVLLLGTQCSLAQSDVLLEQLKQDRPVDRPLIRLMGQSEIGPIDGPSSQETRAWIEAGDLFEKAATLHAGLKRVDFLLFLDPWAAFILRRNRDLWPDAQWVYLSDLEHRKLGQEGAYWAQVEEWIEGLPLDHILTVESPGARVRTPRRDIGRLADSRAYRSVFADPGELLLVAHLPRESRCDFATLIDAAKDSARSGRPARWVVLSDEVLPEDAPRFVHRLELTAAHLFPELAGIADAVVLGATSLVRLPAGVPVLCPADAGEPSLLGATFYDPRSSASIVAALRPHVALMVKGEDARPAARSSKRTEEFILYNDWGIGDEILLSAVAREVVRAWPGTRLWIRSRFGFRFPSFVRQDPPPKEARRVEAIYQNATLYGPEAHSPFPGHLVQQMLDKFFLESGLLVEAKDFRPALMVSETKRSPRTVVLHSRPNPRLPSKDWGIPRWERLADLLHASDIKTLQVGASDEPLLPHAEDLRGAPLNEVPEILARATATVCLVGFLMHAAAATRTPAVVIYGGREHPAIDGYPDHVHLSSGPLPCRGRWGCHLGPEVSCPHGMRCMEQLTPELIAGEVLRIMGPAPMQVAS